MHKGQCTLYLLNAQLVNALDGNGVCMYGCMDILTYSVTPQSYHGCKLVVDVITWYHNIKCMHTTQYMFSNVILYLILYCIKCKYKMNLKMFIVLKNKNKLIVSYITVLHNP